MQQLSLLVGESTVAFDNIEAISSGDDDFVNVTHATCFGDRNIGSSLFSSDKALSDIKWAEFSGAFIRNRYQSNFVPIAEEDW